MLSVTAIIRVKPGHEDTMARALREVVAHVRQMEPDTLGYFLSQDRQDPCVFTIYERYTDTAAMERHNGSEAVARFFGIAQPILDGDVAVSVGEELATKP